MGEPYPQGLDGPDEPFLFDGYNYCDGLPSMGMSTPNNTCSRQTASGVVSSATGGPPVGPSHRQPNKEAPGNEQVFWDNYPTANAYPTGFSGEFSHHNYHQPVYHTPPSGYQGINLTPQDGLPYGSMPVFGEPATYDPASPSLLNSSFSSSAGDSTASERMALMTLDAAGVDPRGGSRLTPVSGNPRPHWGDAGGCDAATISPKMLRINPSPTPTEASSSFESAMLSKMATASGEDPTLAPAPADHHHHREYSIPLATLPSSSSHKRRKEASDKPPASSSSKRRPLPSEPSCVSSSSSSKGKTRARHHHHHHHQHLDVLRGLTPPPPPAATQSSSSSGGGPSRKAKDEFLVHCKKEGMTYKEIRVKGNFTEAESTLRGRYRTLTKVPEARVRKPGWEDNDIRLLKLAVLEQSKEQDPAGRGARQISWKRVGQYIADHGGSYHYGNTTVKRKWDEVVKHEQGEHE
ncbi:hypothetical protein F4780DRAFT_775492 [Xylariomycetidae sp. FL0641]|nr:hypothetical protein F4780DRAFT_775492 [Xylariomycetidae sp. FL0641]